MVSKPLAASLNSVLELQNIEFSNNHFGHLTSSSFSILREINFEHSEGAKFAILSHLEALNFYFYVFLHFLKAEIDQIN